MSMMTATGSVNSSSSSVQRSCSVPSHSCQPCPSLASGISGAEACAVFQIAVWKFARLVCCTRLLRHWGSADKVMFVFVLIISFFTFLVQHVETWIITKCLNFGLLYKAHVKASISLRRSLSMLKDSTSFARVSFNELWIQLLSLEWLQFPYLPLNTLTVVHKVYIKRNRRTDV